MKTRRHLVCLIIVAASLLALAGLFAERAGATPPPLPATHDQSEHLLMGNPSGATADTNNPNNYLMEKLQYALSYNRDRGEPNWVSWHLDISWIGSAPRQDDYREDPTLPAGWYRVQATDYSGSGFDRGHMCPSADRTSSVADNSATFLMTNFVPQSPDNNQGPWEKLESYLRTLVSQGNEIYIVSGPWGIGGTGSNGPLNTVANGHVIVPQKTWKVALVLPAGDDDIARVNASTRAIAVIMPNTQGIRSDSWQKYLATVDQVETLTGYDLFSNVPLSIQSSIESKLDSVNDTAPVAADQTVSVSQNTPQSITLAATDANVNNQLSYTIVSGPSHGTLSGTAPFLTYTPAPNYSGPDSFTFRATDGTLDSNVATVNITVNATGVPNPTPTPNQTAQTVVGLASSTYIVNENDALGAAIINVSRGGDTTTAFTVDYATSDTSGLVPCQTNSNGVASERCDYATGAGTLRFAAGETTKTIQIPIINDAYVEPNETFTFALRNPQGAVLGTISTMAVTIQSDDATVATSNPIDNQAFFIKQQYVDFLGRVAEPDGFNFWNNRMNGVAGFCNPGEICDRIDTSQRFFQSDEFQERGFYVYRLYDAVLGRIPKYAEFMPEVARLNGPQTIAEQRLSKDAYLIDFMNKAEFKTLYGKFLTANLMQATDAAGFVNALSARAGVTPASKQTLIDNLANGTRDPAHTLEDFILTPEISGVGTRIYDRGFITMQYFGYLRRDPEQSGFDFWVSQLIGPGALHRGDYRFMVRGFLQSDEYRFRFAMISGGP